MSLVRSVSLNTNFRHELHVERSRVGTLQLLVPFFWESELIIEESSFSRSGFVASKSFRPQEGKRPDRGIFGISFRPQEGKRPDRGIFGKSFRPQEGKRPDRGIFGISFKAAGRQASRPGHLRYIVQAAKKASVPTGVSSAYRSRPQEGKRPDRDIFCISLRPLKRQASRQGIFGISFRPQKDKHPATGASSAYRHNTI